MAAPPKLSPQKWTAVRIKWENDSRDGFTWLVAEMSLPVSAPAVRKTAVRDGWLKASHQSTGEAQTGTHKKPKKAARTKAEESRAKGEAAPRPRKVSENHHDKVSETMPETIETLEDAGGVLVDSAEEQRGPGRPTAYQDEYSEQAYKLCLLGATDAELAEFFEVSERTINAWKVSQPEFLQSIKRGKAAADATVAESLYQRAIGYSHPDVHISNYQGVITVTDITKHYPPDTGAAFIWLKNRQPHKWKEKVEVKEDINLNVFPSREVLDAIYQKALAQAAERDRVLVGRRERLGIVIDAGGEDVH